MKLYSTADCSGAPAATGSAATSPAPASRSPSPTTRRRPSRPRPPTPPATSAAARRASTYVEDSTAPALPTASRRPRPARPTTTRPAISGTAEAGSTVKLYTTDACTGAPTATGTAAAFATGITVAVADDSSTTFKATATDAAGNVSRLLELLGHLRRGLDRPGQPLRPHRRPRPAPRTTTRPTISGTAEAGSTVKLYTTERLLGRTGGDRIRSGLRNRDHGRGRRRHLHDLQGHGNGHGGQHVRLLELVGHVCRGLHRAGRAFGPHLDPARPRERQRAFDLRSGRGRVDRQALRDERLLGRTGSRAARQRLSRAGSAWLSRTIRRRPSRPRQRIPRATSRPAPRA